MENSAWRELNNELNSDITILSKDDGLYLSTNSGDWPVAQFKKYILSLGNNFIGECTTNAEKRNQVPESFTTLLFKLNFSFKQQFGINFPDGDIPFPLKYGILTIPEVNTDNDPLISIVISKIYAFKLAISYLKTQLNLLPQNAIAHRNRKKARTSDFRSSLKSKQLTEVCKIGKRLGLFSHDTNQKDFIDIFLGQPATNPINWSCTVYALNKFINGINGHGLNNLTGGKWLVTSQLFVVKGNKILESSLLKPGIGENDELEKVETLIDYFNHPDELEV